VVPIAPRNQPTKGIMGTSVGWVSIGHPGIYPCIPLGRILWIIVYPTGLVNISDLLLFTLFYFLDLWTRHLRPHTQSLSLVRSLPGSFGISRALVVWFSNPTVRALVFTHDAARDTNDLLWRIFCSQNPTVRVSFQSQNPTVRALVFTHDAARGTNDFCARFFVCRIRLSGPVSGLRIQLSGPFPPVN